MWGAAPGLIAMLKEPNDAFIGRGLELLLTIVNEEWPQIADELDYISQLANNQSFQKRQNAAFLASRVYYHLGNLDESVRYALQSGELFNPVSKEEFSQTVVAHAIRTYIGLSKEEKEKNTALKEVVHSVLDDLLAEENYIQCMCLAIETNSQDVLKKVINQQPSLITNAIDITVKSVTDANYRLELLKLFIETNSSFCNKFQLSQLHYALHDPQSVAALLSTLFSSDNTDNKLLAYQIAFELAENASQKFRADVINQIENDADNDSLVNILTRKQLLDLYLQFLFNNSKTDIHIIVALKETLDNSRNLVHCSVLTAYSFMFAGTGDDNFYRNNTQWFSNGKKWAQFLTIAAAATIHIGHLKAALSVLQPFLTKSAPQYAFGGGLYGLGLIYANYWWDHKVISTVTEAIQSSPSYVVKHGGCLALGLITMGSQSSEYFQIAQNVLADDTPESGEAAGYAMGMIMLGSGSSEELQSLLATANRTEHDKIVRGCAMGLALMMYGKEQESETLTQILLQSRKPLLRESAAWVTALAYVGTASNDALQRLLHLAVSDVNPDVRRAAVIGVGFVLSRSPERVPGMVDLLARSYHPHVRSGAALALGIACAGTGNEEAIRILKPLLGDDEIEDFVKQHAMIAMAMVLQQQSDYAVPYAKEFRQYLRKLISKKRNEMQVFGLCLAYGILNAGGRNVVISCNSLRGENSVLSTVSIALFCNYFYWTPLALMLALSFRPTAVIGLDKDLQEVDWPIFSSAPPKEFANPPSFESEKEVVKIAKAVKLSISKPKDQKEEEEEKKEEPQEVENDFEILKNPSRVTLNQLKKIDLSFCHKYTPITGEVFHGFVMLKENPDYQENKPDQ